MGETSSFEDFSSKIGEDSINYLKKSGKDIAKIYKDSNGDTKKIAKNLKASANEMNEFASKATSLQEKLTSIFSNTEKITKQTEELYQQWKLYKEAIGDSVEEGMGFQVVFDILLIGLAAVNAMLSSNIIGAIVLVLSALVQVGIASCWRT